MKEIVSFSNDEECNSNIDKNEEFHSNIDENEEKIVKHIIFLDFNKKRRTS
jgi:hypothetical protein